MNKKETIIKNQKGIASMVIVILIMTLLSLIVLSMTKNANREQKQALDRQLNSQAFYAAESGINDAKDYYNKHAKDPVAANRAPESKDNCDPISGAEAGDQFPGYSSVVGTDVNNYSCVLYDATPDSLDFSSVGTNSSVIMPLQDKTGNPIQTLTFRWKRPNISNYDFSQCPAPSSGFPKSLNENCHAGGLRIELIDPNASGRDDLIAKNFVAFVLPSSSSNSTPGNPIYSSGVGTANQGVRWKGGCTGPTNECVLTISGINRNKLLLHLRSIYNDNYVSVEGTIEDPVTSGDIDVEFEDAQMMVDATGKASDILKRVRVRLPLNAYGNGVYPEFSLQTASGVCKLLQILPPGLGAGAPVSSTNCSL